MKNVLIAALLVIGMTASAQQQQRRERAPKQEMTEAQRNELQLKKMTLELDLNASQQKEMAAIIAEQSAKREAMKAQREQKKELAQEQRFERKKKMLDEKIATKARIKKILNEDQFKKWEASHGDRREMMRKHGKNRKGQHGKNPAIQK